MVPGCSELEGVTQFRTNKRLSLLPPEWSAGSLCSHLTSSPIWAYFIKKPQKTIRLKKERKEKDSSPQTKSLWHWFLSLCTTSFAFICSFCFTNLFIQTGEGRPSSREHHGQAWLNGGWKCYCSMFLFHSGYKNSLSSHTSVAQHRFRTQQKRKQKKNKKQQNVKIDLSLKVGEEKQTAISNAHMEVRSGKCREGNTRALSFCSN